MNCPLQMKRCGGCSRLSVPYENQLRFKTERVRKFFPMAGKIIGMDQPMHYRNKVISAFAWNKDGLISGMYAYGTHYVLPVNECLLENIRADDIVVILRKILSKQGIKAYDEDKKTGLVRFVQVRYAQKTGQALVTIVTAREDFPQGKQIAMELCAACPDVRGVVQNINPRPGSAVLGFREKLLWGRPFIEDELCGLQLMLTSRCFYQVNSAQAAKLYEKALDMAQITEKDSVLDAYCGIGIIGLIASGQARQVVGIELNADSVRMAIENAKRNGRQNITFKQGDAGQVLEKTREHFSLVLLDPPREGCSGQFLQALIQHQPDRICYISCNVETQARDCDALKKAGYTVRACQPVDLFPHTDHVENIVLLSGK